MQNTLMGRMNADTPNPVFNRIPAFFVSSLLAEATDPLRRHNLMQEGAQVPHQRRVRSLSDVRGLS